MPFHFLKSACTVGLLAGFSFSFALIDIGTTDASDGTLTVINTGLDLSLAATGSWNSPAPIAGRGVYDPVKWAVVYKVTDLNLINVTIVPHPSGCPVVFLVQNTAQINNVVLQQRVGGFPGGIGSGIGAGTAGLGLGGGQASTDISRNPGGGSHSTSAQGGSNPFPFGDVYGNPAIIPLVGGSGGGAYFGETGGSGGGAILIASRNQILLNGPIDARGSSVGNAAPGSGGGIRLVADSISGSGGGFPYAMGGFGSNGMVGGQGRVRLETNTFGTWGSSQPAPSLATVGATAKIWPSNTDPKVDILSVNGIAAPADPGAAFQSPDVQLNSAGSFTVAVETRNVPTDGSWTVSVRGAPRSGAATVYNCTFLNGNQALGTWTATVPFSEGLQVLQARAKKN